MSIRDQTSLQFCCGVCTSALTDESALFTSCGHFFCKGKTCTSLSIGGKAGKCEQCGQTCDVGTLENRAARYDDQVKQFLFSSVESELKKMAEIVKFRHIHYKQLMTNSASVVMKNEKLKREMYEIVKENESLRSENDRLKMQLFQKSKNEIDIGLSKNVTNLGVPNVVPVRKTNEVLTPQQSYTRSRADGVRQDHNTSMFSRAHDKNFRAPDGAHPRGPYVCGGRNQQLPLPKTKESIARRRVGSVHPNPIEDRPRERQLDLSAKPHELVNAKRNAAPKKPYTCYKHGDSVTGQGSRSNAGQERLLKRYSYGTNTYHRTSVNAQLSHSRRFVGAPSASRPPLKTPRLLRRTDPRSGGSIAPIYGSSLYPTGRIRKPTVPVPLNPTLLSKLASSRHFNRSQMASLHTSTRNPGKSSWQARVSTIPRPTARTDDRSKKRKYSKLNS